MHPIVKPLHKLLAKKVEACVRAHMSTIQKCLSQKEGQAAANERVMKKLRSLGNRGCVVQMDFTNAFGTISRAHILKRLLHYKVPGEIIRYIKVMLSRQMLEFTDAQGIRHERAINRGVPQGEPLSMVLFALGVDELLDKFNKMEGTEMTAYADDIVMVVEKEDNLIPRIEGFAKEAEQRGLLMNMSKSRVGVKTPLNEETSKRLREMGIGVTDLRENAMEYVGLPISCNAREIESFVRMKTESFISSTRELWTKNVPTQMKFHIQEMCLNSRMVFLYKAVPIDKESGDWMKRLQAELDEIWESHFGVAPRQWWRIPIKLYGMGLFHIRDRRNIALLTREQREKYGENVPAGEEAPLKYYGPKLERWMKRGKMRRFDYAHIPVYANTSLSSPPTEQTMRLDNLAFNMLLTTRYCSSGLDLCHPGDQSSLLKCPMDDEPWTVQHVLGCVKSTAQAVRAQHDQLVQYMCGILLRAHNVQEVKRERKSLEQEKRMKEAKRQRGRISPIGRMEPNTPSMSRSQRAGVS